jgi:acyl-CoA thioesterase-1
VAAKIACVGDSITYGYGLSNPSQQSYPAVLQTLLGGKDSVQNFGTSGCTLLKRGDKPYWTDANFAASDAFKPDLVVIMLGTNDAKPQNWSHKGDFASDYASLIDHYRGLGAQVYVAAPPPVYSPGAFSIDPVVFSDEVVPLIHQVATSANAPLIDVFQALSGKPGDFPDTVHPNAEGAKLIAQTVADALASRGAGGAGGASGAGGVVTGAGGSAGAGGTPASTGGSTAGAGGGGSSTSPGGGAGGATTMSAAGAGGAGSGSGGAGMGGAGLGAGGQSGGGSGMGTGGRAGTTAAGGATAPGGAGSGGAQGDGGAGGATGTGGTSTTSSGGHDGTGGRSVAAGTEQRGGAPGAGGSAASPPASSSGCSCHTGARGLADGWLVLTLFGALVWRTRRRGRRSR